MNAHIDKLRRKEEVCLAALLDPDLVASRQAVKREYKACTEERARVNAELAALRRAERVAGQTDEAWLERTVALLRDYVAGLNAVEERRDFLRALVSRADWDGANEIVLSCFLGANWAQCHHVVVNFPSNLSFTLQARLAA